MKRAAMPESPVHADLLQQVQRVEGLVRRVDVEDFDEDVVHMAQEGLSELKAAHQALIHHGEHALPGLISSNDALWRKYQSALRFAEGWLNSLL